MRVEVGIRELKSRLSYYLQLVQAGETVVVKVRNRVVGFLSRIRPEEGPRAKSARKALKLVEEWKRSGFLLSGGPFVWHDFPRVTLKGKKTLSQIVTEMRGEWR